jgi:hypothetical protein
MEDMSSAAVFVARLSICVCTAPGSMTTKWHTTADELIDALLAMETAAS